MNTILQFPITRNNKIYNITIGVTPDNKSRLYFETDFTDEELELKHRYYLMGFNASTINSVEGEIQHIKTTWRKVAISPNGNLIAGTESFEEMITNKQDIAFFIGGLGMPILMSMLNGFVRDKLGFNHLAVFQTSPGNPEQPMGSIINYSEFMLSTAPTNDYDTYIPGSPLPDSLIEPTEDDTDIINS